GGVMNKSTTHKRYTEEFKIEAVRQVTERGYKVADVSRRLGVSAHGLYKWLKIYPDGRRQVSSKQEQTKELQRLKAELRRVTEERDILKKAAAYFAKQSQ